MRLLLAVASALLSLSLIAQVAPNRSRRAQGRSAALNTLREDVAAAMANAQITGKEAKKLEKAREKLLKNAALAPGVRLNFDEVRTSIDTIDKEFRKKPFRAEDRQLVLEDIARLKQMGVYRQPRPSRPPRYPRYPRPPVRRWGY